MRVLLKKFKDDVSLHGRLFALLMQCAISYPPFSVVNIINFGDFDMIKQISAEYLFGRQTCVCENFNFLMTSTRPSKEFKEGFKMSHTGYVHIL